MIKDALLGLLTAIGLVLYYAVMGIWLLWLSVKEFIFGKD